MSSLAHNRRARRSRLRGGAAPFAASLALLALPASVLLPPAAPAAAQTVVSRSPQTVNSPYIRVRMSLEQATSMFPEYGQEVTGADEVYGVVGLRANDGFVTFGAFPPRKIGKGQTGSWGASGGAVVLDQVLQAPYTALAGVALGESDGGGDWKRVGQMVSYMKTRSDESIRKFWLGRDVQLYQMSAHVSVAMHDATHTGGVDFDKDDALGRAGFELSAAGPASEVREFTFTKPEGSQKGGDWRYRVRLTVTREACNADGSPLAQPTIPVTPGFQVIEGTGFAAKLERVEYGAAQGRPGVTAVVSFRNQTGQSRYFLAKDVKLALQNRAGGRQDWPGTSYQWPGPGNVPAGSVHFNEKVEPGGLTTLSYPFQVGDAPAQRDLQKLLVRPDRGGPEVAFDLPGLPGLPASPTSPPPPGQPAPAPAPSDPAEPPAEAVKDLKRLAGTYRTNEGTVITVRVQDKTLTVTGVTAESHGSTVPRQAETVYLTLQGDGRTLEGLWTDRRKSEGQSGYLGRAKVSFQADANGFSGQVQPSSGFAPFPYSGTRLAGSGTGGAGTDGFTRIDREFSVRLDAFRRLRTDQVEALLTVKNVSGRRTGLSHAALKLSAEAPADGVRFPSNGNVYRPTGSPPQTLPSNPWLENGETVQIRYIFAGVPETMTALKRLHVHGYGGDPQTFDLSGYSLAAPAGAAEAMSLKYYDFTVEKLQREAGTGEWQMVLNIRNAYSGRLGVTAGEFSAYLIDADGISVRSNGNLYRASVEGLERVSNTLYIEPNDSVRVRVHFAGSKTLAPVKFRISDGMTKTAPIPAGLLGGQ